MPPTNPSPPAPARRRPPTGAGSPLHFRHKVGPLSGTSQIGRDRHRLHDINEANRNRTDRDGRNGVLGEAKKITTGGSVHCCIPLRLTHFCAHRISNASARLR
jgi:hypothetical protein